MFHRYLIKTDICIGAHSCILEYIILAILNSHLIMSFYAAFTKSRGSMHSPPDPVHPSTSNRNSSITFLVSYHFFALERSQGRVRVEGPYPCHCAKAAHPLTMQ